ncbi:unnamed protein product [Pylaiella littoralis]
MVGLLLRELARRVFTRGEDQWEYCFFFLLTVGCFALPTPNRVSRFIVPVEPKVSQCACMIHTQQKLYLDALRFLMGAIHVNCDCTCSWCDDNGCKKWAGMCTSLHAFSEELACPKVDLLAGDASGGFEF